MLENATRVLALFDFRFIILGLDACPIHIQPRIQRRLQPISQKEAKQLDLPAPKLLWPHVENVLSYEKIINGIFNFSGYAIH